MSTMTSRERVRTLLDKNIPDRMGLYEHFWPETLRDDWPAQGYPPGEKPARYFDFDLVACEKGINTELVPGRSDLREETAEWRIVRNGRGAVLKLWKTKSGTPEHIGFEVITPAKWKEHRERLRETDPSRLGNLDEIRANLAEARRRGKFALFGNLFIFELLRGTIGDEHFLPALLLDPEWIRDFCQVYLDFYRRHYDLLFREVGRPDGFWINEDFGYNKGLFCSPRLMRDLIMPYEKALVSFLKDYGLPVILHSCGDIRQAIPLIIDAGFDCLHPMEAKAGCDVREISRTYGAKLSYMGNLDVVSLSTNDSAVVAAEIVPKLTALRAARIPYFFSSDHSIPPNIDLNTYRYALDLFYQHGAY